jgi:hypothetical protein
MNRDIPVQVAYDRTNKGVDIRNPSTANFLIDSEDRQNYNESTVLLTPGPTSANFAITKLGQNLLAGFFTRVAMTEICLTWNLYNVSSSVGNNSTGLSVRNTSSGVVVNYPNVNIRAGNYTVKTALDAFLVAVNTATSLTFTLVDATVGAGKKALKAPAGYEFLLYRVTPVPDSPAPFTLNLSQSLGFLVYDTVTGTVPADYLNERTASKPNLLAYKYIDITSSQLSSQQKLKDATTSSFDSIDVIYRWNFVNDDAYPVTYDAYGYPILPGYLPFSAKRTIPFPKQVRWDPLLPLGNLQFQTYTDKQTLLTYETFEEEFEFKMLCLVSEV